MLLKTAPPRRAVFGCGDIVVVVICCIIKNSWKEERWFNRAVKGRCLVGVIFMNKKLIIYLGVIILVLAVLVGVFLLKKCVQYYDPISKESSGDCYSVWQRGYWGYYETDGVSGKQAGVIAAKTIKTDTFDIPIVIGEVKLLDGVWWVFLEAKSSWADTLEASPSYWVNIDARKGKVLKIMILDFHSFGEEFTLGPDKGAFFERGELLIAAEVVSRVIFEDPFDEVYDVKLVVADNEELSKAELWLSSTGAEKGKDKLNWRGYSIRVTGADDKVPFAKLVVKKQRN